MGAAIFSQPLLGATNGFEYSGKFMQAWTWLCFLFSNTKHLVYHRWWEEEESETYGTCQQMNACIHIWTLRIVFLTPIFKCLCKQKFVPQFQKSSLKNGHLKKVVNS